MRIAFLGDGSLGHVRRWAGHFHDRGHEILLVSFENVEGCTFPARRIAGILPTKLLGYLSALGRVRRLLDGFRPDLVNALYVGGYGLVGTLSGHRPLAVSAMSSDLLVDYPSSAVHRLQIGYTIRRADLVTTDADVLTDMAVSIGAPLEKVIKVYFGVDESIFHPVPEAQSRRSPGGDKPRIVSTRNLHRIYNIDLLVDAAPMILERFDARFIICGEGPERQRLKRKVNEMGMADSFEFKGKLLPVDVARELGIAAVYVSTSRSDSTSVSLLEAMACGAPPVVTDLDANREWITDRENGLLVSPDDARSLAAAVTRTIEDREFTRSVIERNLRLIDERGGWKTNMGILEKAFEALID